MGARGVKAMPPTFHRTRGHEHSADSEAGLTLAEMLVVLAITAMAAGLVVGRGLPGQGALRSASLEAYLRDARAAAMLGNRAVVLRAQGHEIAGTPAAFDLGRGFLVQIRSTDGTIGFRPDGSSAGGRVTVLAPDGTAYGVEVAAVTGRLIPVEP